MALFRVGEIAILQNIEGVMSYMNGIDVEVVSGLGLHPCIDLDGCKGFIITYIVQYEDKRFAVVPIQLRKKKPEIDQDELDGCAPATWDGCAWKPYLETA